MKKMAGYKIANAYLADDLIFKNQLPSVNSMARTFVR